MENMARLACTALTLTLCACAGPVRYARQDPPAYSLALWVDARHALLDPADALKGCSEWLPKGVICDLAADRDSADVVIGLHEASCTADKDGYRTLALAYRADSRIEFIADCFRHGGGYDRHMFRAVMTHEIGHVIGIWRHVPKKCDHRAPEGSLERAVCGIAVMNPIYDSDVAFVTVIDSLAFDARSTDDSALVPLSREDDDPPADSVPTCTYRVK